MAEGPRSGYGDRNPGQRRGAFAAPPPGLAPSARPPLAAPYVIVWDLAKAEPKHRLHVGSFARVVAFSPDGTALIAGGEGKAIPMWHVASGKALGEFTGHTQMITALLFTPDGKTLISAGTDKTVRLWDVVRQRSAAVSQATQ